MSQSAQEQNTAAEARQAMAVHAVAGATVVNRTHRVVRARARSIAARRSRARSLWVPLVVCSALLLVLCSAIWSVLEQNEITPNGIPDASGQLFVVMMWFLPLSTALLALVWFRMARRRAGDESAR